MHLTRKHINKIKKNVKRRSIRRRTSQRRRGGVSSVYGRDEARDIKVKVHGDYLLDGWKHLRQKFMIAPHETIGYLKQQIKERIRTMHHKPRYEFPLRLMLTPHPDQHSNIKDILTDEMTIRDVRDRYFNDEYDQYEINIKMSEGKYYGPDFSTTLFSRELGSAHPFNSTFKRRMKLSGIGKDKVKVTP
jgi:hypothetical protein